MLEINKIFFDIETTGLRPLENHKITCIGAFYDSDNEKDWFIESGENEYEIIYNFFFWLKKKENYMFISANGKDFDIPFIFTRAILLGFSLEIISLLTFKPHFDIFEIADRKISLNNLAKLYNCTQKSSNGYEAINMYNNKEFTRLEEYCKNDVNVIKEVYDTYINLNNTGGKTMANLREAAMAYEPPQILNIADLDVVVIDDIKEIKQGTGTNKEGEPFSYNYATIGNKDYRIPDSVLEELQTILKLKPDVTKVKVKKSGSGLATRYKVEPL